MFNLSLFEFMLQLRANPRMLARFFPDLAGKVLEPEPRNLSRELKGTPMEMTDFVVVYGFGDPLSHVVAVSFQDNLDPFVEPLEPADRDVVAESDPAREYEESLVKVRALLSVLEAS